MSTENACVSLCARKTLRTSLRAEHLFSRNKEGKYLATFPELHGQKLTLEAAGNEHRVYSGVTYEGKEWIVKVPRRRGFLARMLFQTPKARKIAEQYNLAKKYLDEPNKKRVIPIRVLENGKGDYCLLTQPLDPFHHITRADLTDPAVRKEVEDILERNSTMRRHERKSLGILGKEGAIRTWRNFLRLRRIKDGEITNLVLEEATDKHSQQVVVADFGLMSVRNPRNILSLAANAFLLKHQFDLDFGKYLGRA